MPTVAEEFLEAPADEASSAAEAFLLSEPTTLPSNTFLGPVEELAPAEVARRLGLPGAERLQSEAPLGKEAFLAPFIELPRPAAEADDSSLTQFGKGVAETGVELVEGLESPLGVAVLGASLLPGGVGKIIGRTAAAGFGVGSVLTGFKEAASAYQKGDMTEAGRAVGKLLLGSAMVRGSVAGLPASRTAEAVKQSNEVLKSTTAGTEIPLGLNRPEIVDPALAGLPDMEFNKTYVTVRNEVDRLEALHDKGKANRQELAVVQDKFSALENENFRRNIQDTVPGELFSKLRREPNDTRASIILDELKRQGTTPEELLAEVKLHSPDAAEVFKGQLERIRRLGELSGRTKSPTRASRAEAEAAMAEKELMPAPYLTSLLPHDQAKEIFSKPFGAANIPVIGRILDPHTKMSAGPLPPSLAAFHAEKYGVAPAAAANVGLRLKARGIDEAFPVDLKTGELTTVQPTQPGQSLHPADVMEALQRDPDSYALTPEQRAAFGELEKWRNEVSTMEKQQGITPEMIATEEGDAGYFPRIVIKRPETDVAPLAGGSRVGAKQFFQKSRMFETEREGVGRKYQYEPSLEARATSRTERSYRAMADKRLADDPALGSRTRKEVESELREAHSEEIGAGTMNEVKLQQIVDSVEHKGSVWGQPGFAGKIFDPETANTLNKAFPNADSAFRHNFVKVNNALKAMRLSADVGVALLQGLPTMFRNPITWGKGVGNSFKAMLDKSVMARYTEQNAALANELATYGSSVGRLPEMLAGLEKGGIVERIPVVGRVFKATGRQFETFLDVAKVELWKAWREVTPEAERLQVIRTIESQLSTGRMESIGVSRNRALAERALLLAPSYYRGAVNLIGAMGERGVSGKIARQSIGAYAAGGVASFLGIAYSLGMDEEEIWRRLSPADKNFLMWEVEMGGKKLNVGFGGIHRSLLRLAANMTVTSLEHPGNWLSLTPDKNPLVRWYRGHAASVPGITWDAITGRDFLGAESDLTTLGQSVVPLAAQPLGGVAKDLLKEREPELAPVAVEVGASLIGLSAYPEKRKR